MWQIFGTSPYITVLIFLLLVCQQTIAQWNITYTPLTEPITMDTMMDVNFTITGPDVIDDSYHVTIKSKDSSIARAQKEIFIRSDSYSKFYQDTLSVTGVFLGHTSVTFKINNSNGETVEETSMDVTVIRKVRLIDTLFTISVGVFISVLYINFGCAIDWDDLKAYAKRPIGPGIGFVSQFIFMPLLSYFIGQLLFPDKIEMQLGMFFAGISPGGGASNIYTLVLGGNVSLSITMTAISTLASFVMIPFWLFTLGKSIFDNGKLEVPYAEISMYAAALIVPLAIGFLVQRYLKKVAAFLAKILKGVASFLIVFIIIFAIATNLYLLKLLSWEIVVAGLGLPWLGYAFGYLLAVIFKRKHADCLTIAIETGIQNTGISIYLLRFTLLQPEADLTTVMPVCVSIMSPFPLLAIYLYKTIRARILAKRKTQQCDNKPAGDDDLDEDTTTVL